ncbi:hypothetical protein KSC_060830 [Ktedonobacter sp. SOSP1-52]|nr:hypothetical protein KSC_060830 [Ktedonobacter sp. SOSP1-52]
MATIAGDPGIEGIRKACEGGELVESAEERKNQDGIENRAFCGSFSYCSARREGPASAGPSLLVS